MDSKNKIFEGFEVGDLKDVISPVIFIDRHKSRSGSDDKNIVVTFKLDSKEAAEDLVDFLERGYSFIIDGDVSGEKNVFEFYAYVEFPRRSFFYQHLMSVLADLYGATGIKLKQWKFTYMKNKEELRIKWGRV